MTPERHQEYSQRMVDINRQSAESIGESAAKQREALIDAAFAGVRAQLTYLQDQLEETPPITGAPEEPIEQKVTLTFSQLLFKGDSPQPSLSMLIMPDANLGQPRIGEEKMIVSIPVGEDITAADIFNPDILDKLEKPDYIVVVRYDVYGVPRCFKVTADAVEEFKSAFHEGEQLTGEDMALTTIMQSVSSRVDPMDVAILTMHTDLTNWTTQSWPINESAEAEE